MIRMPFSESNTISLRIENIIKHVLSPKLLQHLQEKNQSPEERCSHVNCQHFTCLLVSYNMVSEKTEATRKILTLRRAVQSHIFHFFI